MVGDLVVPSLGGAGGRHLYSPNKCFGTTEPTETIELTGFERLLNGLAKALFPS
jgi:hypothetical protein